MLLVVMVRAWKKVHRRYRQLLMEAGRRLRGEEDCVVRKGLTPEEFEKAEEARDFELPAPALLRRCGIVSRGWPFVGECCVCRIGV